MAKLPKIVNVADLNKKNADFKIVHFAKAQWKKATGGVPISTNVGIPKAGLFLHAIPDPNGDVTVFPACACGPGEVCIVKNKFVPGKGMVMECKTKPAPGGGSPGGSPGGGPVAPVPSCILQIADGRISCSNGSCTGRCAFTIVRTGGLLRLFCLCT